MGQIPEAGGKNYGPTEAVTQQARSAIRNPHQVSLVTTFRSISKDQIYSARAAFKLRTIQWLLGFLFRD